MGLSLPASLKTGYSFNEIHRRHIEKLPVSVRIIGSFLTYRRDLDSDYITCSELTNYLLDFDLLNVSDFHAACESVRRILKNLVEEKIVDSSGPEKAARMGFQLPRKSKYLYALTDRGKEILRFIYPYAELFHREPFIPVPVVRANKILRKLFGRSYLFSYRHLKKICKVVKFGKEAFVLKKLNEEVARKWFSNFPLIGVKELADCLVKIGVRVTPELAAALNEAFGGSEFVSHEIIEIALKRGGLNEEN